MLFFFFLIIKFQIHLCFSYNQESVEAKLFAVVPRLGTGQQAMSQMETQFLLYIRKTLYWKGNGALEKAAQRHSRIFFSVSIQKSPGHSFYATYCRWFCFCKGVGLDDLQWSPPKPYHSVILLKTLDYLGW